MQERGDNPGPSHSDLALCLQSLAQDGRAAVSRQLSNIGDADALPLLRQLDDSSRESLALELPSFSANAALWAARLFHQLCRFAVFRELPEAEINAACQLACPEPHGAETDWSADLTLRHLPILFQFARRLSNADPLIGQMKQIAAQWPLSSVGIGELEHLPIDSFVEHTGLRRLYADRVLAAGDKSRLGDTRLDNVLRADLGIHRELAPLIATRLFETAHDAH